MAHDRGDGSLRAAWRHREFRLLVSSFAVSGTGDWLYSVALVVFVFDRTGSAGWVAATLIARLVPYVVLSPLGGVLADRVDRRRLMVALDLLRTGLMLALALLAVVDGPVTVAIALAVLTSAANTPYRPAMVACTPVVVGEDDLAAANALEATVGQMTWFAGPALGALIIAISTPAWSFAANALTFLVSAVLVAGVRSAGRTAVPADAPTEPAEADDGGEGGFLTELAGGARAIRSSADLGVLTALVLAVMLAFGFEEVLLVLVAEDRLGLGPQGMGVLMGAAGIGGLVAAPFAGRVATRRGGTALVASAVLMGVPMIVFAFVSTVAIAAPVSVTEGVGNIVFDVVAITLLQRLVPVALLARVFSLQDAGSAATQLLGSLAAPILIGAVGLEVTLVVAGGLLVAFAILAGPRLVGAWNRSAARIADLEPRIDVLASLAIFAEASRVSLERLAAAVREEPVAAGAVLIRQGDAADDFFVARAGDYRVLAAAAPGASEEEINTMTAGDWFGEIGLVERMPRTATVVAVTDGVVWRIPGVDFLDSLEAGVVLVDPLRRGISERLARTPAHRRAAAAAGDA